MFDQPSFYDRVVEKMEHNEYHGKERIIGDFSVVISSNSFVTGKTVRDIMWPNSLVILNIKSANETGDNLDNGGERKLYGEDVITFRCPYYDKEELYKDIYNLVGKDHDIVELK